MHTLFFTSSSCFISLLFHLFLLLILLSFFFFKNRILFSPFQGHRLTGETETELDESQMRAKERQDAVLAALGHVGDTYGENAAPTSASSVASSAFPAFGSDSSSNNNNNNNNNNSSEQHYEDVDISGRAKGKGKYATVRDVNGDASQQQPQQQQVYEDVDLRAVQRAKERDEDGAGVVVRTPSKSRRSTTDSTDEYEQVDAITAHNRLKPGAARDEQDANAEEYESVEDITKRNAKAANRKGKAPYEDIDSVLGLTQNNNNKNDDDDPYSKTRKVNNGDKDDEGEEEEGDFVSADAIVARNKTNRRSQYEDVDAVASAAQAAAKKAAQKKSNEDGDDDDAEDEDGVFMSASKIAARNKANNNNNSNGDSKSSSKRGSGYEDVDSVSHRTDSIREKYEKELEAAAGEVHYATVNRRRSKPDQQQQQQQQQSMDASHYEATDEGGDGHYEDIRKLAQSVSAANGKKGRSPMATPRSSTPPQTIPQSADALGASQFNEAGQFLVFAEGAEESMMFGGGGGGGGGDDDDDEGARNGGRSVGKLKIPEYGSSENLGHLRDVGKLKIPDYGSREDLSHLRDVGKLKIPDFGGSREDLASSAQHANGNGVHTSYASAHASNGSNGSNNDAHHHNDVGRVKIPDYSSESEHHLRDVGKLKLPVFEESKEEKHAKNVGKVHGSLTNNAEARYHTEIEIPGTL